MPQFDNPNDWFENANNIKILEMYCPNNAIKCNKTNYKFDANCDLRSCYIYYFKFFIVKF